MFTQKSVFIFIAVLLYGDAAFVDHLVQCGLKDSQCQKNLFITVLEDYSKTGIPEYNIPIFDPISLKDVSLPLLNTVNLTVVNGKLKGLSGCKINEYSAYIDSGRATMDMTCDLTLKGTYKAFSDSPLIKSLLGGDSIRGDGKAKVKVEQLNLKFDFKFIVDKRDGETYLKSNEAKLAYKYEILGKVVFVANHLYMGDQDISATVTNMLNQNWRLVMQSTGSQLLDKTMERVKSLLDNLFSHLPTKYFITDDLSAYVS